jgi:hypothetical protein
VHYQITTQENVQSSAQSYRVDVHQLVNEKIRQSYSTRLAKNIENITSMCNLEEHATKIEESIKKAIETTISARKITRKRWISDQTLKLADDKRRL